MPLVAHSGLPAFARLRREGHEVLTPLQARALEVRELHVGLLNLMPDAALEATERQFMRLLASSTQLACIHVHPFTVSGVPREGGARAHVESYYEDFAEVRRAGLHALIVTGANPRCPELSQEPFWDGMSQVIEWALEHVPSTVCSCLATHAVVRRYHQIERIKLPAKRWGVYSHRVLDTGHPLVRNTNTRFDAPHSHVYEVTREQLESAGVKVLAESEEAGVHLAVSGDGIRLVYFQGHPEYDTNSLLKEYKRELERFIRGERPEYPPFPDHYFPEDARERLGEHQREVCAALDGDRPVSDFPESALGPLLDNTWTDTGKALFNNWLGLVCTLAHRNRGELFASHVDPLNPLDGAGSLSGRSHYSASA